MTDPATDPVLETAADLWADLELCDEALDRAVAQGGKVTGMPCTPGASHCQRDE